MLQPLSGLLWTSLDYRLLLGTLVDLLAGLAIGDGESEDQESTDILWAEVDSVRTHTWMSQRCS